MVRTITTTNDFSLTPRAVKLSISPHDLKYHRIFGGIARPERYGRVPDPNEPARLAPVEQVRRGERRGYWQRPGHARHSRFYEDGITEHLRNLGRPVTGDNYIGMAFAGDPRGIPPAPWDAEDEMRLPGYLQQAAQATPETREARMRWRILAMSGKAGF
jgi:hypothetical protein